MPEQVGKIIRMQNKFPGGPETLAVNTIGEGLRKHLHLCYSCAKFQPNSPDHCRISQDLFELGKRHAIASIMVRCPNYEPTRQVEVQDSYERRGMR